MLPIVPGCRALIINSEHDAGKEVLVGVSQPHRVYKIVWSIDKNLRWVNNKTGKIVPLSYCPETNLMRIDGGEPETTDIKQYQSKPAPEIVS